MSDNDISKENPVAYFSAEFGFDSNVPVYAGGLGVLSGDTIKQAADDNFPMVGIGLLYRGHNMRQRIDESGMQQDDNWFYDPLSVGLEHVYVDNMPLFVRVKIGDTDVWLRCWKKQFANDVCIYFLDSETDQNQLAERSITQVLYSGTQEHQLKRQLILGIGGVKLLTALGIHPSLYHVNEGRPSFLIWQLIRVLMDTHGISYHSARQLALQKIVYTNHTLVAAGNMGYSVDLLKHLSHYYADKMKISSDELLLPGIENDPHTFAITRFALNSSNRTNGVSAYHSELSENQWPGYHWTSVTNGVHMGTWQSQAVAQADTPEKLWQAHNDEKDSLRAFVQEQTGFSYDPNRLVISWARRIAGYKQLGILFEDVQRLVRILKNEHRPVQLLVSGKAHQGDTAGKELLQKIIRLFSEELSGHALFIPNYRIEVAQYLTRGSDVWLNTPELGWEASGTSGMKAIANGVLNCTISDGWAKEVDWSNKGWVLNPDSTATSLYEYLENEIVPKFYSRNETGLPLDWLVMMQNSIALAPHFSAKRMLEEYQSKLYKFT